jgi:hypothetical protein
MLNNRRRNGGTGGLDGSTMSNYNDSTSLERRHHHWNSSASHQLKKIAPPNLSISVHTETSVCFDVKDSIIPKSYDPMAKRSDVLIIA